ncbi:hypothetical protein F2P81_006748 [Scophthalmus maximus]|uniref:Uncharacterized protein n=1 Tax=Scophthalmus maximus TaxID=52904 RepID=A0A6A4TAF0_SCOMX|nr:hypothetical protein F2P81_006748 [Scophthalmus maximus]
MSRSDVIGTNQPILSQCRASSREPTTDCLTGGTRKWRQTGSGRDADVDPDGDGTISVQHQKRNTVSSRILSHDDDDDDEDDVTEIKPEDQDEHMHLAAKEPEAGEERRRAERAKVVLTSYRETKLEENQTLKVRCLQLVLPPSGQTNYTDEGLTGDNT